VPFQPFVLHTSDGRTFHIPRQDYLYIFPHGFTALVARPDSESFTLVDVTLIASISVEVVQQEGSGSTANGE